MFNRKSVTSIIILCSLVLSMVSGIGASYATNLDDCLDDCKEVFTECICICIDCDELLSECVCPCEECENVPDECICVCDDCDELLLECSCECDDCDELLRECVCACEICSVIECLTPTAPPMLNASVVMPVIPASAASSIALAQAAATPMSAASTPARSGYTVVESFVVRLYRNVLDRTYDRDGLRGWNEALVGHGVTGGHVAHGFFFSEEFLRKRVSNRVYVDILYRTLLNRPGEPQGRADWIAVLESGASREHVFAGFVNSIEFDDLCTRAGIIRGFYVPPPGPGTVVLDGHTMPGSNMSARVWNQIASGNFNGISNRPEHIAGIVGNMQGEVGLALCPFQQELQNNQRGLGLMQWTGGRRTNLENFMWNNNITQSQFRTEMNKHLTETCRDPQGNHPSTLLNRVIDVQIRFMFHELQNTSERAYVDFINSPTNRSGVAGARAYAELFCALNLRPSVGWGDTNNVTDPGVLEALRASNHVGGPGQLNNISYNNLSGRRNNAERLYREFIG